MLLPQNPNLFTRSPLDRAGHRRRDAEWLDAALADRATKLIPFFQQRPFVIVDGDTTQPGWLGSHARAAIAPADALTLFLGVDSGGAAHFAVSVGDDAPLAELGRFDDMRALAPRLSADDLAILGPAKAVFEWHAKNGFCAVCGAASAAAEAGWKRECKACGAEHFPRVDPVCIMLPHHGGRCLLGRQRTWPRGMHSALAGFIEPGEAIEEAVARETLEEAGLTVTHVRMHSTQPWPFPHSLMIGVLCEVADANHAIDAHELESARWFTREESRQLIAGDYQGAFCPPPFAIAHQLLKTWAHE